MPKQNNPLSSVDVLKDALMTSVAAFAMHGVASTVYGFNNGAVQSIGHYFNQNAGYAAIPALGATTYLTGLVGMYLYNMSTDPYFELRNLSPSTSDYSHNNIISHQNEKFAKVRASAKKLGLISAALINMGVFGMTDNEPKQTYTYYKAQGHTLVTPAPVLKTDSASVAQFKH